MKDIRNLLLLVLSICLVGTWGYHLYDKDKQSEQQSQEQLQKIAAEATRKNDSLRTAYNLLLKELDASRNNVTDTTAVTTVASTENEVLDSLRNEISYILAINDITKEDLRRAEAKIRDLQKRIQYSNAGNPNTNNSMSVKTDMPQTKVTPVFSTKKKAPEVLPNLLATGVSFRAIEGSGVINTKANAVSELSISCALQNNTTSFADTDIFIIVADPAGNVIQDDPWQSGMFLNDAGVRIPYTRKSKLSYTKGETNSLAVSLKLPSYQKGTYRLQMFHNSVRIAAANLRLN